MSVIGSSARSAILGLFERLAALVLIPRRIRLKTVLQAVNEAREELDRPPLTSLPGVSGDQTPVCPITEALGALVGTDGVAFADQDTALRVAQRWNTESRPSPNGLFIVKLPRPLERFVRDFDMGAYSSLWPARPETSGRGITDTSARR